MRIGDDPSAQPSLWALQLHILDTISDAVVILDPEMRIQFWNQAATELYGWEAVEVKGRTSREVFPEVRYLDGSPRASVIQTVLTVGQWRGEMELYRRDGQRLILEGATRLLRNAEGQPEALVTTCRDVTAHKQAERVAREQEATTATLADFARALTEAGLNQEPVVDVLVQQFAAVLGDGCVVQLLAADRAQLMPGVAGRVDTAGEPMRRWTVAAQSLDAGLAGRVVTTGRTQFVPHAADDQLQIAPHPAHELTGAGAVVHSAISVPLQAGGATLGAVSLFRDQTPTPYSPSDVALAEALAYRGALALEHARLYEQAQAALASQATAQRRLEAVASATRAVAAARLDVSAVLDTIVRRVSELIGDGCAVCLMPEQGAERIPDAAFHPNAAALNLFRAILDEAPIEQGDGLMAHVVRSGQPVFVPRFTEAQAPPEIRPAFWRYIRQIGLHSFLIAPLQVQEQRIGCLVLVRDQTPLDYTEDDLQLAQELADRAALAIENARLYSAAQSAIKARDSFLSVAAHELKTPLAALLGFTYFLGRRAGSDQPLGDRERRALQMVDDQAQRLDRLVSALLDVARLEAGTLRLDQAPLDLCTLTQRVVAEIEPTLERHVIQVDCPPDQVQVLGDSMRLEQVLQNLLQNGLKYSPRGGPIHVMLRTEADQAVLSVRDAGIGIPEADQAKLFQQFFRARNTGPSAISGMGIGLYVVHEIVSRHGGTVEVRSEEHVGSTFTVRLPLLDS